MHNFSVKFTENVYDEGLVSQYAISSIRHINHELTHGDAGGEEAHREDSICLEDISRALLRSPCIYESRKAVEHKILDHHLKNKYLC